MIVMHKSHGFKKHCPLLEIVEIRKRIVSQAIQHSEESDSMLSDRLIVFLQKINIDGFRPGKAPQAIKIESLSRFSSLNPNVFDLILMKWQEANEDLFQAVNNFLEDQGMDKAREMAVSGDGKVYVAKLSQQFLSKNDHFDETDVELLLWYRLCAYFEEKADKCPDKNLNNSDEQSPSDFGFCYAWNCILKDLESADPDCSQWQEFEAFVEYSREMLQHKLQKVREVNQAWDRLAEIKHLFARRITFLGLEWVLDLSPQSHKISVNSDFAGILEQFGEKLESYDGLRQTYESPPKNIAEEKEKRRIADEHLEPLENDIVDLVSRLGEQIFENIPKAPEEIDHKQKQAENQKDEAARSVQSTQQTSDPLFTIEKQSKKEPLIDETRRSVLITDDDLEVSSKEAADISQVEIEKIVAEEGESDLEAQGKDQVEIAVGPTTDLSDEPESPNLDKDSLSKETVDESEIISNDIHSIEGQGKSKDDKLTSKLTQLPFNARLEDFTSVILSSNQINPEDLQELIWQLLIIDKIDYAYHIARYLDKQAAGIFPLIPSWILRLLILGGSIRRPDGQIAHILSTEFQAYDPQLCYVNNNKSWNQVIRFLLIAASLRPVLFAPNTGASVVLRDIRLKGRLDHLYFLIDELVKLSDLGISIDPAMLEYVRDEASWSKQLNKLQEEVEDWVKQDEQTGSTVYPPATKVWKHLMKKDGFIGQAIHLISENKPGKVKEARQWIGNYGLYAAIDQEVRRIDRNVLERKKGKKIEGKALEQIRSKVMHIRDFLSRWIRLHESHPGAENDYLKQHIEKIRDQLQSRHEAVRAEIKGFMESDAAYNSRAMYAACIICLSFLEDLFRGFDPDFASVGEEVEVKNLLNLPSMLASDPLDLEKWEPNNPHDEDFLKHLLEFAIIDTRDVKTHFLKLCKVQDHKKTGFLLDYAKDMALDADITDLQKQRNELIKRCKNELEEKILQTADKIEKAVSLGIVSEQDRNSLESRRQKVVQQKDDVLQFSPMFRELDEICSFVAETMEQGVKESRKKLTLVQTERGEDLARINTVLDNGDVHTANEYIQLLIEGKDLPRPEKRRDVLQEFIDQYKDIETFLESNFDRGNNWSTIIKKLERHAKGLGKMMLGPVDMNDVRGNHARSAVELISNWHVLKRNKGRNFSQFMPKLETLLEALGFNDVSCAHRDSKEKRVWVDMKARKLSDRYICPVPQYGSRASGEYSLLLLWDRPPEEALISEIESRTTAPLIVFHFGRLSIKRRLDIANLCRRRKMTFLVIDDALLLFLCGEKQLRLPAFFSISLPFTYLSPYSSTSGLVPPEVFFGRQNELRDIVDPFGGCFIFGGRQLGKTALLKVAERQFHDPEEGQIAIFLDLENNGIGLDRPIDGIWRLIEEEMKKHGVISPKKRTNYDPIKIGKEVEKWLAIDQKRRILLMIDEADRFLDSDGKQEWSNEGSGNFVRTRRLKGWMENTQRRLKVVFAGLHNVQRTTRLSNHPLAQFGTPICIGPLLNNGEMNQARELVEFPLHNIGFRFQEQDLSMRILAQTNYYPSLIQLYGQKLLMHVNDTHNRSFPRTSPPPYFLQPAHIEAAYQDQDLRSEIRRRFNLTLHLDPRYEVIAYVIAYECLAGDKEGIATGFTPSWIEEEVMCYWPEGFSQDNSDISLRSLLDEMVGLGILREVEAKSGETRFNLRSPNVLLLLGTSEEIEKMLISEHRELRPPYEASSFRPAYRGSDAATLDRSRRNPLTCEQEGKLRTLKNGVSIVFGSEATGLYDISTFLQGEFPQFFENVTEFSQTQEFQNELEKLKKRSSEGTTILFVDPKSPWPETWIDQALEFVRTLKSKKSFCRVVFAADPGRLWSIIMSTSHRQIFDSLDMIGLTPWQEPMLRLWLEELGYKADDNNRKKITSMTGNWPLCLLEFYRQNELNQSNLQSGLEQFEKLLNSDQRIVSNLVKGFEIPSQPMRIMRVMADMKGPVTFEELEELVGSTPRELIENTIQWGRILSYIKPHPESAFRLDPFLERVLPFLSAKESL